jgi:hypothetical protein
VQDFHGEQNRQIVAYGEIKKAYLAGEPAKQLRMREAARQMVLVCDTSDEEWLKRLGDQVDGNDPGKTQKFDELIRQIQNLKP